ncbi:MAG: hypothetical protein WCZ28_14630 [Burkholderiaceae bacterium]
MRETTTGRWNLHCDARILAAKRRRLKDKRRRGEVKARRAGGID